MSKKNFPIHTRQQCQDENENEDEQHLLLTTSELLSLSELFMPSDHDFMTLLRQPSDLSFDQYRTSLDDDLGLLELLTYERNRGTGRKNIFTELNRQFDTNEDGQRVSENYMAALSSFVRSEFNTGDNVLCVDYENIYKKQRENTNQYIYDMARAQQCNKVLLIAKTQDTKTWIISDFNSSDGSNMLKTLECKTLFLKTSCLYFSPFTDEDLQKNQRSWSAEGKSGDLMPTVATDGWQSMLRTFDRPTLKKLKGTDDAIMIVVCNLLLTSGISVKLLTGDQRIFDDFVKHQKYLPNFRCDTGWFDILGNHVSTSQFCVKFYNNPFRITKPDVELLMLETIVPERENSYHEVQYATDPDEPLLDSNNDPYRNSDGSIVNINGHNVPYVVQSKGKWVANQHAQGPYEQEDGSIATITICKYGFGQAFIDPIRRTQPDPRHVRVTSQELASQIEQFKRSTKYKYLKYKTKYLNLKKHLHL